MKAIQDMAAFAFVLALAILTGVCVLGVWEFFSNDVIWKSFETVVLLALVSVIIIVASRFLGFGGTSSSLIPNPVFSSLRRITLGVLIASAALLAFVGVLTIWDVIPDAEVLYKAIGSLAVLAFGAFLMVVTCMERENNPLLKSQSVSVGGVITALILLYLIFAFGGLFS